MKKFSLEEYLAHPEKKVVTRDGESVRIICCDGPSKQCPIVAFAGDDHTPYCWSTDGSFFLNEPSGMDLFIVEPEPELTEFEKAVYKVANYISPLFSPKEFKEQVKVFATELLDLAKRELCESGEVTDWYAKGKAEALKDLPRWKKATGKERFNERMIVFICDNDLLCTNYAEEGEYYISFSALEKLPKED